MHTCKGSPHGIVINTKIINGENRIPIGPLTTRQKCAQSESAQPFPRYGGHVFVSTCARAVTPHMCLIKSRHRIRT